MSTDIADIADLPDEMDKIWSREYKAGFNGTSNVAGNTVPVVVLKLPANPSPIADYPADLDAQWLREREFGLE